MAPRATAKPKTGGLTEAEVPIGSLVDNPRNPNKHPEEQLRRLMASLTSRGQTRPILARRENRMLVAGHGVRLAAQRLGWTTIRVALWDVDQATADAAMVADNRLGELSEPDSDLIAELLREMNQAEWLGAGFSTDEANALIVGFAEEQVDVVEMDATPVEDKFWISVYGPLKDQAKALDHLKLLLHDQPLITVELGTTTGF